LRRRHGGLISKSPLPNIPTGFLTLAAGGSGIIIGYARVSTTEQSFDLQRDALKRAGCEKIIEDTVSGGKVQRLGLEYVAAAVGHT
jgi:predicted site-specific integrase-resolvase